MKIFFATAAVIVGLSGCASTQPAPAATGSYTTMDKAAQTAMTADAAMTALKQGNQRFVSGNMLKRDLMKQVKTTGYAQYRQLH
jgi:carbonic anhydrase